MKTFLFGILLTISAGTFAQTSFTKAQAKGMVVTFFDGFHKKDPAIMRSVLADNVSMQTASTGKDGKHIVSNGNGQDLLNAIANMPANQKWEEKLLGFNIQIDGNLAHVWTPYEFWVDGAFSHCGANAFTIAKTNAGWKIINVIDSRRRDNCKKS